MFEYLTEEDWKSGEANVITIVSSSTGLTLALAALAIVVSPSNLAEISILAFLSVVLFFSVWMHYRLRIRDEV
jgi:hypothetical protein